MVLAARFSLVMVLVLTIQSTWMADLRPFGATGDLLLLLTIACGLAGGPQRGAALGFACGVGIDLLLETPFGLSSLTYLTVGYVVGSIGEGVLRSAPWIPVVVAGVGSALGIGFYVTVGQLLGQHFRGPDLPRIILVATVINSLLIAPALLAARWIEQTGSGRSFRSIR